VAVKIKLKRLGRTRVPTYRIVVADARTKRDGRAIEEIGKYHPKEEPSFIEVNSERAQHWLSVGAQPTEPVMTILKITGDWQKFKGEPGAEGTLRTKAPAADKKETFAAALKDAAKDDTATAAPRGGRTRKSDTAKPGTAKADTAKADTAKADTAKADTAKADTAKADAKSDTARAEAKPESGRSKSKASAETTAAGSADDSAAAAATSGEATEATEATAAAGAAGSEAAPSSEPGSGA
jgi:small subunit ribosomal protein S16